MRTVMQQGKIFWLFINKGNKGGNLAQVLVSLESIEGILIVGIVCLLNQLSPNRPSTFLKHDSSLNQGFSMCIDSSLSLTALCTELIGSLSLVFIEAYTILAALLPAGTQLAV